MNDEQLNIGAGHELDQILVHNISNKDFSTLWGGNPHTVESGKTRVMLRHIAVKFARELSHRIITAKADNSGTPITQFLPEKLTLINKILVKVHDRYQTTTVEGGQQMSEQEINQAQDMGTIDILEEYGIPIRPVKESPDDIKENFREMTPAEKANQQKTGAGNKRTQLDDIGIIDSNDVTSLIDRKEEENVGTE